MSDAAGGWVLSELEMKLKSYKTIPQPKEQALDNLRRLKAEIGMKDERSSREEVKAILKKAGSLSDEISELRKKERM